MRRSFQNRPLLHAPAYAAAVDNVRAFETVPTGKDLSRQEQVCQSQ